MYLYRSRSSRFKLIKLRILSNNPRFSTKSDNTGLLSRLDNHDSEKRDSDLVPSKFESTFDESLTFDSNFLELSGILNGRVIKTLESNGFVKTTPIQRYSIPKILEGSTVLIRSPSGTGKTLTFLVPALQKLVAPSNNKKITRKDGTKVLIIAPTRELSFQIYNVAEKLSKQFPWIVVSCIKGGESRKSEKARIRKGITIVIGTPGRILDHIESTSSFNLSNLEMLVLDEADRLLDMGFEGKIRTIHAHLLDFKKSNRENSGIQIVLTSATITDRVTRLVETCFVSKPIIIGLDDETPKIPSKLSLEYVVIDCNNKFMCLVSLLLNFISNNEKIIVFVSNCDSVNYMYCLLKSLSWSSLRKDDNNANDSNPFNPGVSHKKELQLNGFNNLNNNRNLMFKVPIFKLHGDMDSTERMPYMNQFIKSKCSILVSTDVASRGLNLSKVNRVIQYDPPQQLDEFIHRSGRTARIGDSGTSILVLIKHERGLVDLLNKKGMKLEEIPEESLWNKLKLDHSPKYLKKFKGDLVGFMRNRFCMNVKMDNDLFELGKNAFKSSIRSYKTYSKELRKIFNFRNLHLGHYATSFCLNVKPTELMTKKGNLSDSGNEPKKRKNVTKVHSDRPLKQPKMTLSDESMNATEQALKYLKDKKMIL